MKAYREYEIDWGNYDVRWQWHIFDLKGKGWLCEKDPYFLSNGTDTALMCNGDMVRSNLRMPILLYSLESLKRRPAEENYFIDWRSVDPKWIFHCFDKQGVGYFATRYAKQKITSVIHGYGKITRRRLLMFQEGK